MAQPVTKDQLDTAVEVIRGDIRDFNRQFIKSQANQNERIDAIAEDVAKIKLAVVDLIATDRHLHNLVRELKEQGLKIDESKIFAS